MLSTQSQGPHVGGLTLVKPEGLSKNGEKKTSQKGSNVVYHAWSYSHTIPQILSMFQLSIKGILELEIRQNPGMQQEPLMLTAMPYSTFCHFSFFILFCDCLHLTYSSFHFITLYPLRTTAMDRRKLGS